MFFKVTKILNLSVSQKIRDDGHAHIHPAAGLLEIPGIGCRIDIGGDLVHPGQRMQDPHPRTDAAEHARRQPVHILHLVKFLLVRVNV